jgi:hypothetical protein
VHCAQPSMRLQITFFIFIIFPSATAFAQVDFDETKMVGFACFYEGRETKVVTKVGRLLRQKKYSKIRDLLKSQNTAEQYLAVICIERLSTHGKVDITDKEKLLIEQIRSSAELVATCSGCFPHPGIALKDVFNSEILWRATSWLDRYVKL